MLYDLIRVYEQQRFNSLGSNSPQLAADLKRDSSAFSLRMTLVCHAEPNISL